MSILTRFNEAVKLRMTHDAEALCACFSSEMDVLNQILHHPNSDLDIYR